MQLAVPVWTVPVGGGVPDEYSGFPDGSLKT